MSTRKVGDLLQSLGLTGIDQSKEADSDDQLAGDILADHSTLLRPRWREIPLLDFEQGHPSCGRQAQRPANSGK